MANLKGDWGDRLTAFFNLSTPAQWSLPRAVLPVVDVSGFVARVEFKSATGTSVAQLDLTVPDQKRWYVFAGGGTGTVSGNLFLQAYRGTDYAEVAVATSATRVLLDKAIYLDGADFLRLVAPSGNLAIRVMVFEYDVEHP